MDVKIKFKISRKATEITEYFTINLADVYIKPEEAMSNYLLPSSEKPETKSEIQEWFEIAKVYLPGERVRGKIIQILNFGILVEIPDKKSGQLLPGLIRNEELSWKEKISNPWNRFIKGQEITTIVLKVDVEHSRLLLSLRRVDRDPWNKVGDKYKIGTLVHGVIIHLLKDAAFVDLEEGLEGIIPVNEIMPGEIVRPNDAFKVGDDIKAIIISIESSKREIILSLKEAMIKLEKELDTPISSLEPAQENSIIRNTLRSEQTPSWNDLRIYNYKTRSILVVDDNIDGRNSLASFLKECRFEVDTANGKNEAVKKYFDHGYDLIIMDVRMPSDLEGVEAAAEILQQMKEARIILYTDTGTWENAIKEVANQNLNITGMLLKPVAAKEIFEAIRKIEETGRIDITFKPMDHGLDFIREMTNARRTYDETLETLMKRALEKLSSITGAEALAIFNMDSITFQIDMVASFNISVQNFLMIQHKLRYSPVKDVLLNREHILVNHLDAFTGKFKYLYPITLNPQKKFEMKSCIAAPVDVAGRLNYGVFLFHSKSGAFSDNSRAEVEKAALLMGTVIGERMLMKETAAGKRFELLGQLVSSLGHELRGYLTSLDNRLEVLRLRLDTEGERIRHNQEVKDFTSLKEAVEQVIDLKTKMFGFVRAFMDITKSEQVASVYLLDLLENAKKVIFPEANRAKVEILLDKSVYTLNLELKTIPVILQQIFLNVFLNAVQHMRTSKRNKGRVIVSIFIKNDNKLPVKIRFKDTGPGIHADIKDLIFEPMFSTKKNEQGMELTDGTGMGLAICRSLLGTLGGKISLEETAIYIGSTFLIELPKEVG
jgi:signal transduction histidine kinase/predicted RNA-binding protein with RPS1 domain/DNA-binding NarL/FixJ family response regulator